MSKEPRFINVSSDHELLRRDIVGAIATFQKLPPLERLAVLGIVLGQQVALTEGYDRRNIMDMVAANIHFGSESALDARRIITF